MFSLNEYVKKTKEKLGKMETYPIRICHLISIGKEIDGL